MSYSDGAKLFSSGGAAMLFDGSWSVAAIEGYKPSFDWGIFAPPPPAGMAPALCVHPDAALGVNPASQHLKEATAFALWLSSTKGAESLGNRIPGFFPPTKEVYTLQNPHSAEFLALSKDRTLDARWPWPRFMDGQPSAYELMQFGIFGVLNGSLSPEMAADQLAKGIGRWYKP